MDAIENVKVRVVIYLLNGVNYNTYVESTEAGAKLAERVITEGFLTTDKTMLNVLEGIGPHRVGKVIVEGAGKQTFTGLAHFISEKWSH